MSDTLGVVMTAIRKAAPVVHQMEPEIRQRFDVLLARAARDPRYQSVYDDTRRPENPHVDLRVRRYDRQLFLRFNRLSRRWEVWRWRSFCVPSHVPGDGGEVCRRAAYCGTIMEHDSRFAPVDWRLYRRLRIADMHSRGDTGDAVADSYDEADRRQDLEDKREIATLTDDWRDDNKYQLRSFINRGRTIVPMS